MRDGSTLVLTSRELDFWLSLQEVVPAIERVWAVIGQSKREDVHMFCVPLAPEVEQRILTSTLQMKHIVIIARTPETVRIGLYLRLEMNVVTPMILYAYGDALEGFQPFGELRNFLTERDTLVVASEAEVLTARCCFPNAHVSVIPFPLVDKFKVTGERRDSKQEAMGLAYVGRVSEQKNLHTLLLALWVLRISYGSKQEIALDIYGAADNLGTPHSGLHFPNYGTYLYRLAQSLGIHDIVTWHGFKPREWLFDNVHTRPHIYVSPTLHSDENFGSSLLASLANGHQAVTTAWGGHFGFQEWFSEQLTLVPVHRSTMGPVVDPVLLANAILRAMRKRSTFIVDEAALGRARAAFSESSVTTLTLELLNRPEDNPVLLEKSPLQRYIDERRVFYGGTSRIIYSNYADPVLQVFYEAYGMKEPIIFQERAAYVLPPWTSYVDNILRVDDPHRGHQIFHIDPRIDKMLDVMLCPSMVTCRLPENLVKTLVTQGYAFVLPEVNTTSVQANAQQGTRSSI